jgi:CheY-like chemotaxis protein
MSSKTILCIDDNPAMLECMECYFGWKGYTVLSSSSGRRGLEVVAQAPVDAVILDYLMPEMNGDDVAAAIRSLKPETPIVMFSGTSDIPRGALKAVDAFVGKNERDGLDTIEHLLETLLMHSSGGTVAAAAG